MTKLHLGCGKRYLAGYDHVDLSSYDHIKYNTPIFPLAYIDDDSIEEIYCSHALEYFDFAECLLALKEWHRILNPNGGQLRLSVPDFDKLLKVYALNNNKIESIVGPLFGKWSVSSTLTVYHKTVFTQTVLTSLLQESGFASIEEWDPFVFHGQDETSFDDYSKACFPHMAFDTGMLISLNLLATK